MQCCHICITHFDFGATAQTPKDAVAICNELKRPVCEEHAKWCVLEGHGTSPLEKESL